MKVNSRGTSNGKWEMGNGEEVKEIERHVECRSICVLQYVFAIIGFPVQ